MTRFLLIALALLLMTQACMSLILLVRYQVNKEYIAVFLCENRDKPEMHCEGKCHLKETMTAHEKLVQSVVGLLNENFQVIGMLVDFSLDIPSPAVLVGMDWSIKIEECFIKEYNEEIFHPPCLSPHAG